MHAMSLMQSSSFAHGMMKTKPKTKLNVIIDDCVGQMEWTEEIDYDLQILIFKSWWHKC